ncbi:type VI secretion system protein [Sorangium sp. So ce1389]|uniref:type VI secretion system protein n=1 Tax=Sorangium sp. So ce1389 TaxID=3133336 RepID=UPI003F624246
MSGSFVYELASVHALVEQANPESAQGIYAVPCYLVLGEPGSGRSTVVRSMNLTWPPGGGPLPIGVPGARCSYWLAKEALFIEPEASVLGPRRQPAELAQLCEELRRSRKREAIDGILLVLSIAEFVELDEQGVDAYANRMRAYLIEVGRALRADVPAYVVLSRYDTLWGFAEVFQWTPERGREEPWGFTLPLETSPDKAAPRILQELEGLNARLESYCLARVSSEDPPDARMRAFQHLAEVRALMARLRQLFGVIAMENAFERAPWIRAVAIGSALPGMGDRLRAGVTRFINMGLAQPPNVAVAPRPGGLPIHATVRAVVLPERDIVPLRPRWRDDRFTQICFIGGVLLLLAAGLTELILRLLG